MAVIEHEPAVERDERDEREAAVDREARSLDLAADLLEAEGWCRHEALNAVGERCALGALGHARRLLGLDDGLAFAAFDLDLTRAAPAYSALRRRVGGGVSIWNDDEASGRAEVVAELRAAAEDLRARPQPPR